jgi:hypothetical protein
MLTNGIVLAMSGRDILRSLGIYYTPFTNNVNVTKGFITLWTMKSSQGLVKSLIGC